MGLPWELLCPKSLCLAVVTASGGAWWSVGTLDTVTRILIDQSECLAENFFVLACACPAAGKPAPRPRAPLTTLRRKALCSDCVIGSVPRMLLHALAPRILMTLSQSQGRCDTEPASLCLTMAVSKMSTMCCEQ